MLAYLEDNLLDNIKSRFMIFTHEVYNFYKEIKDDTLIYQILYSLSNPKLGEKTLKLANPSPQAN